MKCPKCQKENREEARFCSKCGTELELVCPKCQHRNEPDSLFCDKCGTSFAESEPTVLPKLEDMQKQLQDRIPQSLADRLFAGAKQMQGEYRLVTALFADMSGSSTMARDMPLEQYVETMNDCFKMMVDTISIKYEGSINRFIGDCVLAFFGAPITHENDAERAILAALDIREGVKKLGLNISIGINTGTTYVGEMGSDLYLERSAWGPDMDFAKRLQESAEPGQIWIGASTYRLTRRAFDFDRPVEIDAKGAKGTAYSVLRIKELPEKLRGIEGLRARMIGREREFADLKETADNLISGRGGIVTIIGEAGLGKSRLASELKEYLKDKDISWYEGRSISLGQTISYWPFLDILKAYLNLSDTDSESGFARKLRESIADLFPGNWRDILPLLGNLLSIKFGDELDDKLAHFTPEQIRHQTLMRLKGLFTAISRRKPLLLILEDLHWADDLSLDLISLLMDDLAENQLLLMCIYRPERSHRCLQIGEVASRKCLERYTGITLKKLSAVQSRQLVESLLTIDNLPEPTKDMILKKSEGNPFFIEEVIRSLIDRDIVYREDDRWKARKEIEDIDVPDTIQSVLLSRVDRLQAETRYVLQCASVIGRLFRYRLLDHLSQHERDLEEHLSQLEERELIYEERSVPEQEYAFKHALTQEATYQGILERRRREFHHQVGEGIETLYSDRLEEYYGELAYHYSRSADREKAVQYLIKAGNRCRQIYANQDAIRYFSEALALLDKLNEHESQRLEALEGLGDVHYTIGKHNDAIIYFEKAIALGTKQGITPARLAELYFKIGYAFCDLNQLDKMIETAQAGLAVLGENTLCPQGILLYENLRHAYYHKGDEAKTVEYASKNAAIVRNLGYFDGIDKVYTGIAWTNGVMKGNFEYSISWTKECMEICERHGDKKGVAFCCIILGDILNYGMNSREAIHWYKKSISIAEDIGDVYVIMMCYVYLGIIFVKLKDLEDAEEHLKVGADIGREIGKSGYVAATYRFLGEVYRIKQDWDKVIDTMMLMAEFLSGLGRITNIQLAQILCILEEACEKAGRTREFAHLCDKLMELVELQNTRLTQWYLKPKELSGQFTQTAFSDDFAESALCSEWQWINPRGNCGYELNSKPSWLEIQAASGCDLLCRPHINLNAPRLVQEISGDFAIETKMASADEETPTAGGLLIWKDKDNFIRFERGMHWTNEIGLSGNIDGNTDHFGRGMLISDTIYMRIERIDDILSAYCSKNGENWLTCGEVSFPVDDPIQVGIHAIGSVGKWHIATVTQFDYFRVLRRKS